MIVTRRRRKSFPWKRFMLPLIAVALVAFAMSWQPSRDVIAKGPMAPLWRACASTFATIATPFHFSQQNQLLTQRNVQIASLQKQVTQLQSEVGQKRKQIDGLNSQVSQLQTEAAQTHDATAPPLGKAQGVGAQAVADSPIAGGTLANATATQGDFAAGATQNMRRTAQYWANMEPQNAAKAVQKLPVPYVARVLSLMSPDAVGSILDALPASFVAQLTQEHPELKR